MKCKTSLVALLFLIVHYCQSQNNIRTAILPKIKAKIDFLYPNAANIHAGDISRVLDSTQLVFITCNCSEGLGDMYITFDTNGNILNKVVFISKNDLPDSITHYINRDTTKRVRYIDRAIENVDNKGNIYYKISKLYDFDGPSDGNWIYVLKFNKDGGYISEEKQWHNL